MPPGWRHPNPRKWGGSMLRWERPLVRLDAERKLVLRARIGAWRKASRVPKPVARVSPLGPER